jgi:hypothetical protein
MFATFLLESQIGRDYLEDPGVDRRIILKMDIRAMELESVDWIHLVQDRYQWWTTVNMVMNLQL